MVFPPIRDPNDLYVLQARVSGKVNYLCTLDEHFNEPPMSPSAQNGESPQSPISTCFVRFGSFRTRGNPGE